MARRWATAGLLASLVALTGCRAAVSAASPTTTTTVPPPATSTSTTLPTRPEPPSPDLQGALDGVWSRTSPGSCLTVLDGARVVYERNPDDPVMPASTMKLLTATALLAHLDPSSRLTTRVTSFARPGLDGVLHGDVFLVGGGDPLLGTLPYRAHFPIQPHLLTAIEVLADRLRDAGVHHITGRVLGDDSRYDRQRYVPSWSPSYVSEHEAGPLSALLVNDGAATWGPRDVPFADPAEGAAKVFTEVLRQHGVTVDGAPGDATSGFGAADLATMDSPTIGELVQEMLLDSNNNTAELLLKELGRQVAADPSTEGGRRVVLDTLAAMGAPMGGTSIVDGSGLDRGDRVTCRLLAALLSTSSLRYPISLDLPVAGRTGTLWNRFRRTPVAGHLRAKTGTVRSVSGLAGYADAPGRQLTFVYIQNNVVASSGLRLQDDLAEALVTIP